MTGMPDDDALAEGLRSLIAGLTAALTCLAAEYTCFTSGSFLMIHSPNDRSRPPR